MANPENGQLTGKFEAVEVRDRMKASTTLLDKGLPNTVVTADTGHELLDAKEAEFLVEHDDALQNLSLDDLRSLANSRALSVSSIEDEVETPW
jgi:hypothetical protein